LLGEAVQRPGPPDEIDGVDPGHRGDLKVRVAARRLFRGLIDDPEFVPILERDLREGQHRNATARLDYFTTACFHLPAGLAEEARAAGLAVDAVLAVEGPAWLIPDLEGRWRDESRRVPLLDLLRRVEAEPAALAMSAHLLLVAHKA
jgi:hypothetical protein